MARHHLWLAASALQSLNELLWRSVKSFPDWVHFQGGSDHWQQQVANAVPPLMAAAVAWSIGENWRSRIAPAPC